MASDVQARPSKVPSTKAGLAKWLEMALYLGSTLEPRVIMMVLTADTEKVINEEQDYPDTP
eukprot:4503010-Prorocentrum_lima.AAC.1